MLGSAAVEWHRMAGAVLMALAVLMHQHGESMATHHMTAGPRTDHGTVTGHDAALVLLRAATAAYQCPPSPSRQTVYRKSAAWSVAHCANVRAGLPVRRGTMSAHSWFVGAGSRADSAHMVKIQSTNVSG